MTSNNYYKEGRGFVSLMKIIFSIILMFKRASTEVDFQCSSLKQCYCFEIDFSYEFFCPADNSEVRLTVKPEEGAKIQCLNTSNGLDIDNKLAFLSERPFENASHANFLKFQFCSIPTNFANTISILGLDSTKKINFLYNQPLTKIDLDSDIFTNLTGLEEFILSDLNEAEADDKEMRLTINVFDKLVNLTMLDLSNNGITELPTKVFSKLKRLNTLVLQSNKLLSINPVVFKDLQDLEILDLSFNRVETLPRNLLFNLTSLLYINLMYNNLSKIPNNVFVNNKNLDIVHLNANPITQLPDYLFANFSNLTQVHLHEAELTELPNHIFAGSNNLVFINLSANNLKLLPVGIFAGLTNLEFLDLKMNKLEFLPTNIFDSLIALRGLDLQYNLIGSLDKRLFRKLVNLEAINLRHNVLTSLDQDLFKATLNLQRINLADNFVTFPYDKTVHGLHLSPFVKNENLREIDLSNNRLTQVNNDWISNKPHLEGLDLSYNFITAITFKNLNALSNEITINLSHNNISILHFQDASTPTISEKNYMPNQKKTLVLLNDNPLDCNCFIYDFLKYFDVSADSLTSDVIEIYATNLTCALPSSLLNKSITIIDPDTLTCSFKELKIESCSDECNCFIRPSDRTIIVDCSNRNLTSVPHLNITFLEFNNTEVHLQSNNLTSGPLEGMGYENVTKLFLSSNYINDLKWLPENIETLQLDNNSLNGLSLESMRILESFHLSNISLGNNPWICNCSTRDFYNFLISYKNTKSIDVNEIKCNGSDVKIGLLHLNQLCMTSQFKLYVSLGATLIIFITTICLLVVYYQNQRKIKVWLFAHNMFLWFVTEEELDKDKHYDAFISYSHKDEDFVTNELQQVLENESLKLCLHVRDWIPGGLIASQIVKSINNSRRTLVVLSPNFLDSVWGNVEFHTAHMKAMKEGRVRVIVILYGDIQQEQLDDDLKAYIETNTYVKWGDPWFWQKLKYALPHNRQ